MKCTVNLLCFYNGHNIVSNGNVNLKIKCRYSELSNYIQLIQMLNNDVSVIVHPVQEKLYSLGIWRVKDIKVDHDGEGFITFNSATDFVEVNNINRLVSVGKDEEIKIVFTADVEVEDQEDNEEWD